MSLVPANELVYIQTPAELAEQIFTRLLEPLLRQHPGQKIYPPINAGDVLPHETQSILCRDCRGYGYEAEVSFEGSTYIVTLKRIPAEHERGAGDDFPHQDP